MGRAKRKRSGHGNPGWAGRSRELRSLIDHCVVCFSEESLVVHHLRYRGPRGTAELPEDLVVICAECHNEIHRHKLDGPANFRKFRDQVRALLPLPEPRMR